MTLEYQLLDRCSSLRSLDLTESSIPTTKTIWLFRDRLAQVGGGSQVFEQAQQQLLAQGSLARCGQIVDVSLMHAWRVHIRRRGHATKGISETQKRRIRAIATPRAPLEHVFGPLAQMGGQPLRCSESATF